MHSSNAPDPSPTRLAQLHTHLLNLANAKLDTDGFIPFDVFMAAALYTPNLGYYTATRPVGSAASGADFTTAPEISPLFGHTIARAIAPCFANADTTTDALPVNLLECGAGTGKLAKDVLDGLALLNIHVERYAILELSASLRAQQQLLLADYPCVVWLDRLPDEGSFTGLVLANELLDALPVRAFVLDNGALFERGVRWDMAQNRWVWTQRMAQNNPEVVLNVSDVLDVLDVLNDLSNETKAQPVYEFERGEQASAWVASMAQCIKRGAMLLIDYGFARAELYHPQRSTGTLMAHRLHQATPDVLAHVGDADITAHVDFSAIARAASEQGMRVAGFVNQARFLINADIAAAFMAATTQLTVNPSHDAHIAHAQYARGVQLLMSEAEMGELFKVIALTRNCPAPAGFERGDRSHRLAIASDLDLDNHHAI